jgi:hypothetical protein
MPDTSSPELSGSSRAPFPPLRWILRRITRMPHSRRVLLIEAVFWLAAARIALVAVPFRNLAERFGAVCSPRQAALATPGKQSDSELSIAREVGWAVTRAARYVPFRAVCLPQAIAAKAMLDRRRVASVMHFGVAKNVDGPMDAHAWLDAGVVEVTGYPIRRDFVEVACFL